MTSDGRISVAEVHLEIAKLWALRSTCSRRQVGAVIALDGRTLISGYNGAPAGIPHCSHRCDCDLHGSPFRDNVHRAECASVAPCEVAVHAEANVIAFAARNGIETNFTTMYATDSPCLNCAMLIINAGVSMVVYLNEFRDMRGAELLTRAGVPCVEWKTGFIRG